MSHKLSKRSRQQATAAESAPPSAAAYVGQGFNMGFGGVGNGHQGADFSRLRGMVYFPELDTRREITAYTRLEILRRARFLDANYGIAKRIIDGIARMVAGTGLTPQATTKDTQWNALAEKAYHRATSSKFVYDLGARYNAASSQFATLRFRLRDGDCGQVLTRDPKTGIARFAFYEGHQIGNAYLPTDAETKNWYDGVRVNSWNAPELYRVLGEDDTYTDIPAQSFLFQCDYKRAGQSRGLSILSHAVNNLLDVAEIGGYIKSGVKLSNRHGYWIERTPGTVAASAGAGARQGPNKQTIQTAAGPVVLEQIYGPGAIPELNPGESIKFNSAANPHPNQLTFLDYLIRDAAWGSGYSPELLWNITALGGANTRFVLADAQGAIELGQQDLIDTKLQPEWQYVIACEIMAGRLRTCADPDWWKVAWIPPPRITVDFGRDGKLHLAQVKAGALTYKRMLGWQGLDSETELNAWLDEMKFIKDGAESRGLDSATVMANLYGSPGMAQQVQAEEQLDADGNPITRAPEDAADTQAKLSALLKKPGKAEAFLKHLQGLEDAA